MVSKIDNQKGKFKLPHIGWNEIEIQKESAEAITKMAELQKELEVQKKIRSYTEKCEAKAKVVNELPVQYITKRHIDECDNSIKNMTSTLEIYDDRIRKRVKQYGDMMLSIDVLCQPLEEPNCTDTNNTAEEEEEDEEDIDNRNDNLLGMSKVKRMAMMLEIPVTIKKTQQVVRLVLMKL